MLNKDLRQDIYSREEVLTNKIYKGLPVYRKLFTGKAKEPSIKLANNEFAINAGGFIKSQYGQYWIIGGTFADVAYATSLRIENDRHTVSTYTGNFYNDSSYYEIWVEYTKEDWLNI